MVRVPGCRCVGRGRRGGREAVRGIIRIQNGLQLEAIAGLAGHGGVGAAGDC